MTLVYRHLPELIKNGNGCIVAVPPLYRIDIGKETYWAGDDAQRDKHPEGKGCGRARRPTSPGSKAWAK